MCSSEEPTVVSLDAADSASVAESVRLDNRKIKAMEAASDAFLWGIGIRAPSPNQARKVCEILMLNADDEKRVKAVAQLARQEPDILQEVMQEAGLIGDNEMDVKRGSGFFKAKADLLAHKLVIDLFKEGMEFRLGREQLLLEDYEKDSFGISILYRFLSLKRHQESNYFSTKCIHWEFSDGKAYWVSDAGFNDLILRVKDKKAMVAIKKFARAWEAKSRQLKGSREATVTIIQDFG